MESNSNTLALRAQDDFFAKAKVNLKSIRKCKYSDVVRVTPEEYFSLDPHD